MFGFDKYCSPWSHTSFEVYQQTSTLFVPLTCPLKNQGSFEFVCSAVASCENFLWGNFNKIWNWFWRNYKIDYFWKINFLMKNYEFWKICSQFSSYYNLWKNFGRTSRKFWEQEIFLILWWSFDEILNQCSLGLAPPLNSWRRIILWGSMKRPKFIFWSLELLLFAFTCEGYIKSFASLICFLQKIKKWASN